VDCSNHGFGKAWIELVINMQTPTVDTSIITTCANEAIEAASRELL